MRMFGLHAMTQECQAETQCCLLQPGKCLYTSVRELVENSLDAAESIGQLPDIAITM